MTQQAPNPSSVHHWSLLNKSNIYIYIYIDGHFIWGVIPVLYLCHTYVVIMFYLLYHVIIFQKLLMSSHRTYVRVHVLASKILANLLRNWNLYKLLNWWLHARLIFLFFFYYNVFFLINMWQYWITMRLMESLNSKFLPQVGRAGITWMPSNWTQIALWLVGCWALDRMWIVSPWTNPTSERSTYNQRYHNLVQKTKSLI